MLRLTLSSALLLMDILLDPGTLINPIIYNMIILSFTRLQLSFFKLLIKREAFYI